MNKLTRRSFLRSSAGFAAAALAGREWLLSGPAFAAPAPRPFEMLVLGDSVMWGQGLREEAKSYSLVHRWLQSQLGGRAVSTPVVMAHSGASILPKEPCPRADGEVNIGTPTIKAQVDEALREYASKPGGAASVDLVLVNGGINDLGFPNILNILHGEGKLERMTRDNCGRMRELLDDIVLAFPNARVMVTNYYPIISEMTERETLVDLAAAAFTGSQYGRAREWIAKMLRRKGPLKWANDSLFKKLVKRSQVWYEVSNDTLRRAVDDLNRDQPLATLASTARRAHFARVDFKPEHAYGVPRTSLLWRVKQDLDNQRSFLNLITEDHLFDSRLGKCSPPFEPIYRPCGFTGLRGFDLITCRLAAAGHPNEKGAAAYAEAIIDQLGNIVAQGVSGLSLYTGHRAEGDLRARNVEVTAGEP